MAMKPAGKAIIILAIVGAVGAGVWKSGLLDKAPVPVSVHPTLMPEPAAAAAPAPVAPVAVAPASPAPAAPAAPTPAAAPAKDAMDALIHEQKK